MNFNSSHSKKIVNVCVFDYKLSTKVEQRWRDVKNHSIGKTANQEPATFIGL